MFAAVDLRRILRRFNRLTQEIENIIAKPIEMMEAILEHVAELVEGIVESKTKTAKKKK
jgi:hypothetical protein